MSPPKIALTADEREYLESLMAVLRGARSFLEVLRPRLKEHDVNPGYMIRHLIDVHGWLCDEVTRVVDVLRCDRCGGIADDLVTLPDEYRPIDPMSGEDEREVCAECWEEIAFCMGATCEGGAS